MAEDFDAFDNVSEESGGQSPPSPEASNTDRPETPEMVKAFVTKWTKIIKSAKKHHDDAFKRMDECMQLAKDGGSKEWTANKNNYTVPVLTRLTNQSVAQLYARHPETYAKRKKRRMFTKWDGTIATLTDAEGVVKNAMMMGLPPDPNSAAIVADAYNVKAYDTLMDGIADTLTILHNHFMEEQSAGYKSQFKALVRRVKVVGVGYVKLCFQRILEKNPDITVKINEATERQATLRALIAEAADGEVDAESAEAEQIKTLLADLQAQETLIVSEGPLYSFPRPKSIIIDKKCTHLKTFLGADWIAEEFQKTPEEILTDYQVDIKGDYTAYKDTGGDGSWERFTDESGSGDTSVAKVWRVQNRKTAQEFTICEGYDDYLKPPAPPDVQIARFFDIFPLVFNEVEDEKDIYPPSDIWNARHMQNEYNRTREFLREHRLQNRPGYIAGMGTFEEKDLDKLQSHPSGAIIIIGGQLTSGDKIGDKLQAKPVMQIDPKQYEVDSIWQDILRVTGDQQADAGPTTTATATESSIAEQGRTVGLSDSVDDIDDLLSLLAQSTGQLMLTELSKQTVMEIVGPGAVWPDAPETREDIAEEISLDIRAGSSGRPNKAIDMQNLQGAMPVIMQIPGINPVPFGQKILDIFDIDAEDGMVEGLPSMAAVNAMASHPPPPPGAAPPPGAPPQQAPHPMPPPQAGPPNAPNMQGPQGIHNAPKPPGVTPPPHPTPLPPMPPGHIANGAPGGRPIA